MDASDYGGAPNKPKVRAIFTKELTAMCSGNISLE